eukprot:UN04308
MIDVKKKTKTTNMGNPPSAEEFLKTVAQLVRKFQEEKLTDTELSNTVKIVENIRFKVGKRVLNVRYRI